MLLRYNVIQKLTVIICITRSLVAKLRRLEKDTHLVQRALAEEPMSEHLHSEMANLEAQVSYKNILHSFLCNR